MSDKKLEQDKFIQPVGEPTRNTTLVLTIKHYNFLQSVRLNEIQEGRGNLNMSEIIKEALNDYQDKYQKKYGVKINDKGFVIRG